MIVKKKANRERKKNDEENDNLSKQGEMIKIILNLLGRKIIYE